MNAASGTAPVTEPNGGRKTMFTERPICGVKGCDEPQIQRGRCAQHYRTATHVLTPDQVRQIRADKPTTTMRELAERYGVSISAINHIVHGRNWRRLPQEGGPL